MLYSEIPVEFIDKMDAYWKNMFSQVISVNDNILSFNKVQYPANIKTEHCKLPIGSPQHQKVMTELFFLLHIFHQYSGQKQFKYTISSGTILGYYSSNSVLPWDDDIDVIVPFSHFEHMDKLWNNISEPARKIWDHNWSYKPVEISGYKLVLLKCHCKRKFYKLKLNTDSIKNKHKFQRDIGGLDITYENGFHGCHKGALSSEQQKNIFENDANYFTDKLCGIEISVLTKEVALTLLAHLYPRWQKMKHPQLF